MAVKVLNDGLGFDESLKKYYVNFYIWKFAVPGLSNSVDRFKSGITKYDVYRAMEESAPTRGKVYSQIPIWGFDNDRIYLPDGINESEANLIIQKTDLFFKDTMEEHGYTLRSKGKNKDLGTEVYEGESEKIIDLIKNQWAISLKEAISLVTDDRCDTAYIESKDISTLGSQKQVAEDISDAVSVHHKVRAIMPGGYGKGLISFVIKNTASDYRSEDVILYGHNIPATKQMARKHAMYESGTKYAKTIKRIVICSETKIEKEDQKYGIDVYYASDENLVEVIKEYLSLGIRKAFYVNKKSSKQFSKVWNQAISELGIQKKLKAIIDETQEFSGEKGSDNTDPVENPIWDRLVSLTASERRRGKNKDQDRIFNDDIEYFGKEIIEVTPSQALIEGRICEIKFKTIEISDNNPLLKKIIENKKIRTEIKDGNSIPTRGTLLKNLVQIVKAVHDGNSHIANITSFIKDCQKIVEDLEELKKSGIIPNDYQIIRAKRTDGLDAIKKFNSYQRGIIVGTPWMITGIDAPKIDAITSHYDMGSDISASQYINRGQRPWGNKVCTVYMWIDPTKRSLSSMQRVAANLMLDRNSHLESEDYTLIKEDQDFFGSKKVSPIESEFDKEQNIDSIFRDYWDSVYSSFVSGEYYTFNRHTVEKMAEDERSVLSFYNNGQRLNMSQIASIVGISGSTVERILQKNSLRSWDIIITEENHEKILELYHNGEKLNCAEIGRRLDIHPTSVIWFLKNIGLKSWEIIENERIEKEIVNLHNDGQMLSSSEIAKLIGESTVRVSGILKKNDLISWNIIKNDEIDQKILDLYHNGEKLNNQEIADILGGIRSNRVSSCLRRNKLESWESIKRNDIENKVLNLYHNGEKLNDNKIAEIVGISDGVVRQILRRKKLVSWDRIRTIETEKLAIELYHNGERLTDIDIARRMGMNTKNSGIWITNILRRKGLESWDSIVRKENTGKVLDAYNKLGGIGFNTDVEKISGVHHSSVSQILKKNNLSLQKPKRDWLTKEYREEKGFKIKVSPETEKFRKDVIDFYIKNSDKNARQICILMGYDPHSKGRAIYQIIQKYKSK